MNITVNINAPELAGAIQALAEALKANQPQHFFEQKLAQDVSNMVQQPTITTQPEPHIEPPVPVAPIPTVPVQTFQQPILQQPIAQQPQAVPTSAPTYTMDQLAVAATQLVDAGRRDEITQLLTHLGANPPFLMQLPKEQYGAFATKLREMGAKI